MDELAWAGEWFRYADMDLQLARQMSEFRPTPTEYVCFHAQQSAEKNLKAYLLYKSDAEADYTHNLVRLCEQCAKRNAQFAELAFACSALNPYGVAAKYPDEACITEKMMNDALNHSEKIKAFTPITEVREAVGYVEIQMRRQE